jgi:hypothetical protein
MGKAINTHDGLQKALNVKMTTIDRLTIMIGLDICI